MAESNAQEPALKFGLNWCTVPIGLSSCILGGHCLAFAVCYASKTIYAKGDVVLVSIGLQEP